MRVTPIHETHSVFKSTENIKATIDAENLVSVLGVLTNLYSDPVRAVVREYSTNALDSHVAAGVERPIEISLPTRSHRNFVVRDFGVGLDLEELRRTYLSYGASTKRDSDDYNGTLGLGSKSGLTYAPLGFQVAAVKDGQKILAVITQDVDGVGVMRVLDQSATAEGNGVTITIPVNEGDEDDFVIAARNLFKVWAPGTVLVDGEQPESIHDDADLIWVDEGVAIGRNIESKIIMGNVPYRLNRKSDWGYGVIAEVPMGSVHFTPSREDLHYTDHTNETVETLIDYVNHKAEGVIREYVQAGATPWLRLKAAYELKSALDGYRGQKLLRTISAFTPNDRAALQGVGYRWRPDRSRNGTDRFSVLHFNTIRNEKEVVITGYPSQAKNISPTMRERLRDFASEAAIYAYGSHGTPEFVLLPKGSEGIEMLEGRPNVYTWEYVQEITPKRKVERGTRSATKPVYAFMKGGVHHDEVEVLDPANGPIILISHSRWGDGGRDFSERYPECQVVVLKANRVARFERTHSLADGTCLVQSTYTYVTKARAEAAAALSHADLLRWHGGEWQWLKGQANRVDDVELGAVLRELAAAPSAAFNRAKKVQVQDVKCPAEVAVLDDRYPLINALGWQKDRHQDEIVLYINAKWAQVQEERAVAAEAEALANSESVEVDVDGGSE